MFTVLNCLWFQRVRCVSACCRALGLCVFGLLPDLTRPTYRCLEEDDTPHLSIKDVQSAEGSSALSDGGL